jgi:hypothetical protein
LLEIVIIALTYPVILLRTTWRLGASIGHPDHGAINLRAPQYQSPLPKNKNRLAPVLSGCLCFVASTELQTRLA